MAHCSCFVKLREKVKKEDSKRERERELEGKMEKEKQWSCDNSIDEIKLASFDKFPLVSEMKLAICEINEL